MARDPSSSYSFLDTHIFLNVSREARIEPLSERRGGRDREKESKVREPKSNEELYSLQENGLCQHVITYFLLEKQWHMGCLIISALGTSNLDSVSKQSHQEFLNNPTLYCEAPPIAGELP